MATGGQKEVAYSLVNVGTRTLESTNSHPYYSDFVVSGTKIIVIDMRSDVWNIQFHRLCYGELLETHQLKSVPCSICLTSKKEICVILLNGQIQIMSLISADKTGVTGENRTVSMRRVLDRYHDVVGFKENLVVSGENKNMMSWCIVKLADGDIDTIHHICEIALGDKGKSVSYVAAKDDVVYISCYIGHCSSDNGVYGYAILNPNECKYTYKHKELSWPTGITINQNGFIFVCNSEKCNPSIHQITDDCQLVSIFRQGIPPNLLSISWVPERGRFYATCCDSTVITVFKPESRGPSTAAEAKNKMDLDDGKEKENQKKVTEKRKIEKGETFGPTYELASAPKKMKAPNLEDQDKFLEAVRNNDRNVEEIINQKIPKANTMEVAVRQYGYSQGVRRVLNEMSRLLRVQIYDAVSVWCGYRPREPDTPVFVVTLKNQKCTLENGKIPEPFIDYKIITRYNYVPNNEERCILELCGSRSVNSEDVAHVNNCIAAHSERLMREHSNLSIIRGCSVKARGYTRKKLEVEKDTCIVFYVPVKGIIPVGENELPNVINDIVTDVREGEFTFFADHKSFEYLPKLRMGCCISRCVCRADECTKGNNCSIGTLGGFINLTDKTVGCLTAAHVVLVDSGIKTFVKNSDEGKRINSSLAEEELLIQMHQPLRSLGHKPFGKLKIIALEEGNIEVPSVDAAVLEITDVERIPESGRFPDGDFEDIFSGLTKEDPLLFTSGKILDETEINQNDSMVIKFGCVTGLTFGYLNISESCVREVTMDNKYCFPIMFRQLEVKSNPRHVFAANGDSGAIVFLCIGGNIRNLRAVGMVIGGNTAEGTCVVTPIKAVFNKLGLETNRFIEFPPCQTSEFTEGTHTQSQPHSILSEVCKSLSYEINSLEKSMSNRMRILEEKFSILDDFNNTIGRVDILEKGMNEIKESLINITETK